MGPRITNSDLELFGVLADYRVLTAPQAAFVLDRNSAALRRRLSELADRKLIDLLSLPASKSRGRPSNLYAVTPEGHRTLIESGSLPPACGFEQVGGESALRQAGHKLLLNLSRLYLLHAERQVPGLSVRFHAVDSPIGLGSDGTGCCRIRIRSVNPVAEEWVLYPDAVIAVTDGGVPKTLLFFLEVDMGTEPVVRKRQVGADIAGKIQRYQAYFGSRSYKEYEPVLKCKLNGFRVLFLANTPDRQSELYRAIRAMPPSQFIWTASFDDMRVRGMSGAIWVKGGKPEDGQHSILGRYSQDAPLPEDVA